ncbi:glycosyltransferase family 2 protein [Allobranchiibius sp. GilTou38]|uniref:glycosyltransferase family 2 protein n=1 Tax=Allobranchiibius sp. GilTou38 TaxID=2815210 RepID=UPI001AA0C3E5|nr:glycosyltransferase family 2 protein [Allobranchiibius sp. GilTou38]MBO1767329.1 glycosyltransferase family 2 protein [Allobranchiibius sp. GilTou38]
MYRNSPRSLAEGSIFEQRTLETERGRASRQPTITVVVPAKNEADNLRAVLPTLPPVHEVILVDGDSTDGTVEVARQVMPDIKVVKQTRKGKGNALACGFKAATGDIIVMFDADGSADAREIPAYVDALINGADFAKGSRFIRGGGSDDITLLRHVGATGLHVLVNLTFGQRFSDLCYGYNAFWTELVPALGLPDIDAPVPPGEMIWGDGFEIETVINLRMVGAGVQIREVPSIERPRIHGESNLRTFKDGFRVLRTIVSERQRATALRRRGATVLTTTTAPAEQVRRPSISA